MTELRQIQCKLRVDQNTVYAKSQVEHPEWLIGLSNQFHFKVTHAIQRDIVDLYFTHKRIDFVDQGLVLRLRYIRGNSYLEAKHRVKQTERTLVRDLWSSVTPLELDEIVPGKGLGLMLAEYHATHILGSLEHWGTSHGLVQNLSDSQLAFVCDTRRMSYVLELPGKLPVGLNVDYYYFGGQSCTSASQCFSDIEISSESSTGARKRRNIDRLIESIWKGVGGQISKESKFEEGMKLMKNLGF